MTKFIVQAFDRQGRQILGTMNGQTVITAKQYKRTHAYKALLRRRDPRVAKYEILRFHTDNIYGNDFTLVSTIYPTD